MKRNLFFIGMVLFLFTSCQQAKNKVLELAVQQVNKECPMVIDEVTKLDSATFDAATNTFSYYYTLSGVVDDPAMVGNLKSEMEKSLPEIIKQKEEMKAFRELDVIMDYIYLSGKTKEELFMIRVTPEQYK